MKRAAESHPAPRARSLCIATCGMLAVTSAIFLAGCGQRGPLYLPQRTGTVVTRRPAGAPTKSASSSSSADSNSSGAPAPEK